MHLLGDDHADPALVPLLAPRPSPSHSGDPAALARALAAGATLVYVRERTRLGRALRSPPPRSRRPGTATVALDLAPARRRRRRGRAGARSAARGPARGCRARRRPGRGAARARPATPLRRLARGRLAGRPHRREGVGPGLEPRVPARRRARPAARTTRRAEMWRDALGDELPPSLDAAAATAHFRLGPEQVDRAARAARLSAALGGRAARRGRPPGRVPARRTPPGSSASRAGSSRGRLGRPGAARAHVVRQLREIAARAAHRDRVLERLADGRGRRPAAAASPRCSPATPAPARRCAAEVLAGALGLDLYAIDLATVVDKYIGETEKNLDRIFAEADQRQRASCSSTRPTPSSASAPR